MIYPEGIQEKIEELSNVPLNRLSDADKAFIRARAYYLDPRQEEYFANLFVLPAKAEEKLAEVIDKKDDEVLIKPIKKK